MYLVMFGEEQYFFNLTSLGDSESLVVDESGHFPVHMTDMCLHYLHDFSHLDTIRVQCPVSSTCMHAHTCKPHSKSAGIHSVSASVLTSSPLLLHATGSNLVHPCSDRRAENMHSNVRYYVASRWNKSAVASEIVLCEGVANTLLGVTLGCN